MFFMDEGVMGVKKEKSNSTFGANKEKRCETMKIKERTGAKKLRVKYIEGAETRKTTICANSLQILASAKAGLTLDNTSRASLIAIFIQSLSFPEIQIGNLFIFLCV